MALYPNSLAEHGPLRTVSEARLDHARERFPLGCFVKLPDLRRFIVTGYTDDGAYLIGNELIWGGYIQLQVERCTRYIPRKDRLAEEEAKPAILFDEVAA